MQNDSLFNKLNPKQSFLFGIVGGILVLCTIGFFILLFMFTTGGTVETADNSNNNQVAQNNKNGNNGNTENTGNNQPSQPSADLSSLIPVDPSSDHIRGAEDASITIVEYSDLKCPFCNRFHNTMKRVMNEYDGQVRWVYRHFPLTSLHPEARKMAIASECAADQGSFWEFTDKVFKNQKTASAEGVAEEIGLDVDQFQSCLENEEHADIVKKQAQNARKVGGRGTPHSIIIGPDGQKQALKGAQPFSKVSSVIDQYLN
jgi:protein-disulfide isomerase